MSSSAAEQVFRAALRAMDPAERVRLALANEAVRRPVTLVALGKAAPAMARGATEALGDAIRDVVVVAPRGTDPCGFEVHFASHPVPDDSSERAGRALLRAVADADPSGQVLALVSGGGSALACAPAAGLELSEKAEVLDAVYRSGADIRELNTVRAALSRIKGGGMARAAAAPVLTLVASDVVGDDPAVVASGPTAGTIEPSRALDIVTRRLGARVSPAVRAVLESRAADVPATRDGDRVRVVAGLEAMARAAAAELENRGYQVAELDAGVEGDVAEVADRLAAAALGLDPGQALVWAGEATIELPRSPGVGGRAHQIALSCAAPIAGSRVQILAAGTDGIDGSAASAGAVVSGGTSAALAAAGIDPAVALAECDAGSALARVGCSVTTGATGLNHADLYLALSPLIDS